MDEQSFQFKVFKSVALFLIWISMGLYLEIPGPTLIDIKLRFGASYDAVSRSVSGRGAGGFVGALIGGILVERYEGLLDIFVAVPETIAAAAIFCVPFSPDVTFLWFHYFVLGACGGVISIAGVRDVICLWKDKTAVTLQLLTMGYGVGALLVPLLVTPFLAVLQYADTAAGSQRVPAYTVVAESSVQYAFMFVGGVSLIFSLVFYYFQILRNREFQYSPLSTNSKPMEPSKSFTEMVNPATYANGSFSFGLSMFVLLFIYFFNLTGGEEVFANFIRSFSVDKLKFDRNQASYLNMSFWLALTISRLLTSVISNYVSVKRLFALQIIAHAIATTFLNIYATQSASMLWLSTVVEGLLISPLYPGGIAYGNTQMEVSGICLMVIAFSSSLGDMAYIRLSGSLYDTYGPTAVLYGLQMVGVILVVCLVLFRLAEACCKPTGKPDTAVIS